MKQILIVEDDSFLNKMLAYNLTADGYGVTSALNARTAADAICIGYFPSGKNAGQQSKNGDGYFAGKAYGRSGAHRLYPGNPQPDG